MEIEIPQLIERSVAILPVSWNEDTQTVEVVFTTGERVLRPWFRGQPGWEELSVNAEHMHLSRFKESGIPVLTDHDSHSVDAIIGISNHARLQQENGQNVGIATIEFDDGARAEEIKRKVKKGIIRNVSIGYSVRRFEKYMEENVDLPIYRAVDWMIHEISFVVVGADSKARVRSPAHSPPSMPVEIIESGNVQQETEITQERTMPEAVVTTAQPAPTPPPQNFVRTPEEVFQILDICSRAKLPSTEAQDFARSNKSMIEIQNEIINRMANEQRPERTVSNVSPIEITVDEVENVRKAVELEFLYRFDSKKYHKEYAENPMARQLNGRNLVGICQFILEKRGRIESYYPQDIAERSLGTTSDFPIITLNVANKILRQSYEEWPAEYGGFVREREVNDMNDQTNIQFGGVRLSKMTEGTDIPVSLPKEALSKTPLDEWAGIFQVTDKVIINDNQNAILRVPQEFAKAARYEESQAIYNILIKNQALNDKQNLFSAQHANLAATPSALSITSLGAARSQMRLQKDLDGRKMNLIPRFLIVPPQLEMIARQIVGSEIVPNDPDQFNPFRGTLTVVVASELQDQATSWYLAANVNQIDIIQLAFLSGQRVPQMRVKEAFEQLGVAWRCVHRFGVGLVDYRGLYKNAGA